VVALGKDGDRVDVTTLQRFLPFFDIEVGANAENLLGCMKIEMNLTKP
jgi:hypothetical protein